MLDCEAILSTGIVTVSSQRTLPHSAAPQHSTAATSTAGASAVRATVPAVRRANGDAAPGPLTKPSQTPRTPTPADAASVGDATPPEAELGDTTGDEGESGDDGSCGSLAASLSDDDGESDAGDVVIFAPRAHAQGHGAAAAARGAGTREDDAGVARFAQQLKPPAETVCVERAEQPKADEDEDGMDRRPAAQKLRGGRRGRGQGAGRSAGRARRRLGNSRKRRGLEADGENGYAPRERLGASTQGRTDILPIPAPRRGTRDCENPGLGAPEAAPVEAPKVDGGPGRETEPGRLRPGVGAAPRRARSSTPSPRRRGAPCAGPEEISRRRRGGRRRGTSTGPRAPTGRGHGRCRGAKGAREAPRGPRAGQGAPGRPRRRRRLRGEARTARSRTSGIASAR